MGNGAGMFSPPPWVVQCGTTLQVSRPSILVFVHRLFVEACFSVKGNAKVLIILNKEFTEHQALAKSWKTDEESRILSMLLLVLSLYAASFGSSQALTKSL